MAAIGEKVVVSRFHSAVTSHLLSRRLSSLFIALALMGSASVFILTFSDTSQINYSPFERGLSASDFIQVASNRHNDKDSHRFGSSDSWRPKNVYDATPDTALLRPHMPKLKSYHSKAQYLQQPIVADYPENAGDVFLMMKEGATVLWDRIPVHLITTFTRVPHFSIYADYPSSVGGYEIVDILANVTQSTKEHPNFRLYRKLMQVRKSRAVVDPKNTDLNGGWVLDKYKNIPMLAHALKTAPPTVKWFVFMDGDTFFFMDNLLSHLSAYNHNEPLYLGSGAMLNGNIFAHGGSGVVLSRTALEQSLGQHPEWEHELEGQTQRECCGDYMVAQIMNRINVSLELGSHYPSTGKSFQGQPYWSLEAGEGTWCQKIVSFHHLSPLEIEVLWEFERLLGPEKKKDITYADMYLNFVLPYIKERMEEWDNLATMWTFSEKDDKKKIEKERQEKKKITENHKDQQDEATSSEKDDTQKELEQSEPDWSDKPWHSEKNCRDHCTKIEGCMSWRYIPRERYCGLAPHVKLGQPVITRIKFPTIKDEMKWDMTGIVSGFMINRIRSMRSQKSCDILYGTNKEEEKTYLEDIDKGYVKDRFEGWFLRQDSEEEEE